MRQKRILVSIHIRVEMNIMRPHQRSFVVDDVNSRNIEAQLIAKLLELFGAAMSSIAQTHAREAKFNTTDFTSAGANGCAGFTLLISRSRPDSSDSWFGAFQRGDERLEVVGHLKIAPTATSVGSPTHLGKSVPRRRKPALTQKASRSPS